ncbi:S-adenosyl-L-methionine-dependent methyltransferase [Rhodocollybia butyracea]|uniref:S-adenosyl-L-methionine-dependent methyltransferase n=1 Tax=Rhodocollybia butyracea TaxID=206335 RepID=A0A9P5U5L5_9AGAR|nr:S-adenosyl-L-methionine-dependent methyltransferase [Rhodocollybia butyracea]
MAEAEIHTGPHSNVNTGYYFLREQEKMSEWDRLDRLHNGINNFLEGKLALVDIGEPLKFLDLGCGSGAWAVQAASMYPQACIIAADIKPLPDRPLPSNIHYQMLDLLNPIPLAQGIQEDTFDVIHMRLVLYHIPRNRIRNVLIFAASLLKPSGSLLIEDAGKWFDFQGPAMAFYHKVHIEMLIAKGLDPLIGEHLEEYLHDEADKFQNIQAKCVCLTLAADHERAGTAHDLRNFSDVMHNTLRGLVQSGISQDHAAAGITPQLQQTWLEESNDPNRWSSHNWWFVACQKVE